MDPRALLDRLEYHGRRSPSPSASMPDPPFRDERHRSAPLPADVVEATREIERLRRHRGWRERDLSISGVVTDTLRSSTSLQRKLGALIDLWQTRVPPDLVRRTRLSGLRGGVLHVSAESAAVAFELDRLLRQGLLSELRQAYRGTLSRVKVTPG